MSQRRLLLLLSVESYRASDFLSAARKLSLDVVIGTERTLALASRSAGGYLTLPFDDVATAVQRATAFASERPLSGVVVVDDEAVVAGAAIANALGLEGNPPPAAAGTRDKAALREALQAAGLPHPWFRAYASLADIEREASGLSFPCVLKPRALSASRGVIRADDAVGLIDAAQRVFRMLAEEEAARRAPAGAGGVIVEGFLPGAELAVEALLEDGRLTVLALFDKPDPLDGPYFEETLYITPSRTTQEEQDAVVACVRDGARALGLRHGPVHAEVRLKDGRATLVEVAARTIGGLCARTLRFGAGMSLEEVVLRQAAGMPIVHVERERRAAGVMMLPIPRAGVLRSVAGVEAAKEVPGVEEVSITAPLGHPVVPLPEGRRYLGFAFARAQSPALVEAALREAHHRLRFTIEGDGPPRGR